MSFGVAASLCFLGAPAWLMVVPDQQLKSTSLDQAQSRSSYESRNDSYQENC